VRPTGFAKSPERSSPDRDDVHLYRRTLRKFGHAHRRSRMPAPVADVGEENFRSAVHDLRLLHESRRRRDVAGYPENLFDPVEAADGFRQRSEA
jgi:hypothetical protein